MTIFEQLVETFHDSDDRDRLFTTEDIRNALLQRYGANPRSVLPSDYCYNRWNQGLTHQRPLFVRVGAGEYRYLGLDYPYTGIVFWRPNGATADRIAGERVNGVLRLYEGTTKVTVDTLSSSVPTEPPSPLIELSPKQLDRLYEEYMEILMLEVGEFGCKPTETRHLVGRLGEFYCARVTGGQLARRVNQPGFDVVGGDGKRISVKTTAQRSGFISINPRTLDRVDDLMVLRYADGEFEQVYHGGIELAIGAARVWRDRFELDIAKARMLLSSIRLNSRLASQDEEATG